MDDIDWEVVEVTAEKNDHFSGLMYIDSNITDRLRLEKQLLEQAEYAELLFRTVPSAVISVDKYRKIIRWNKFAEEITGYKAEEVLGKECSAVLYGVGVEGCGLCFRAVNAPIINVRSKILTKDGKIRHVLKSIAVLKDEFGEICERISCFEDITVMINMEIELWKAKEWYSAIVNSSLHFVVIHKEGIIKFVNEASKEALGYKEEYIGRHIKDFLTEESLVRVNESIVNRINGLPSSPYEIDLIKKSGEIINVLIGGKEITFGREKATLAIMMDITESKRLAAKLRASEEKLRERDEQTHRELLLAARVQKASLPNPFAGNKVHISTIFEPFNIVSGDLFNYRWFEDQAKLSGYLIDVSGHGVATALQTATFKMMLDNVLLNGEQIDKNTLQKINREIMQYLYEGSFVALIYFEFDLPAGELKLISAGITLYLRADALECALFPISGCYLGIVDEPEMEMQIIPLKAGQIYGIMSDGVSDLIEASGICKQGDLTEFTNWFEELAKSPERKDDFTVICVEVLQEFKETNIFSIKNDKDLADAQQGISEFLERNAPFQASGLEVAVNEAVNNGLKSGSSVLVKARCVGRKLIIRVKDDGLGFDTKIFNSKLELDNEFTELLEAEGGRGILLMRLFCDRVIYNAVGNEVLLMKKIF